jgi:hypothetical protein
MACVGLYEGVALAGGPERDTRSTGVQHVVNRELAPALTVALTHHLDTRSTMSHTPLSTAY